MSMIGNFLLLSDGDIDGLVRAPETVHSFLERRVYEVERPVDHVDVDKAWHALHFLLTGAAWDEAPPLDFIAVGGEAIGDVDVGYGPARVLRPAAVQALHRALEPVCPTALVDRYDGARMDELEIYPAGGWRDFDPRKGEDFAYYSAAYEELRALVRRGAETGTGLMIWLS